MSDNKPTEMPLDPWTEAHQALWQRICAHRFEDPAASLDFTRRLARDHGWSVAFARDAIEEYRRFAFLAVTSNFEVTPSPIVDEVWHLHLTYTEDYWGQFCPHVLRVSLHHDPTEGGAAERQRFASAYQSTLDRYESWFGTPPASMWPSVDERFRRPTRFRWIDIEQHRLLPRRVWRPLGDAVAKSLHLNRDVAVRFAALLVFGIVPLAAFGDSLPMNPMDWPGPEFLKLYLLLLVVTVFAGLPLLRRWLRNTGDDAQTSGLSSHEIAYLIGGSERAFDAAIADLMAAGAVSLEIDRLMPKPDARIPPGLPATVMQRLGAGRSPKQLLSNLKGDLDRVAEGLIRRGLLLSAAGSTAVKTRSSLLPLALLLFGITKIVVGHARGKPVGILVVLSIVTGLVTLWAALALANRRTRAGDRVVADYTSRYSSISKRTPGADLGLAVGLFGTSVMASVGYAHYHQLRRPPSSGDGSSSSSDGGSGGGDGGGSGCGSGCGGCGSS